MGKPFSQELELLHETFTWSMEQQIDEISAVKSDDTPVLVVGSGGSLSACFLLVSLLQTRGILAKAITPLELHFVKNSLKRLRLIFISAGGKNNDIMFAYKTAIEFDPISLLAICMRHNTPLGKLSSMYTTSKTLEYRIPAGKDGFLATNSLIAYFTFFLRAFEEDGQFAKGIDFEQSKDISRFALSTTSETTISVLYGGWGHPVAVDIESKFTEAALGNVHMADYRNFAHGRHHWFAKRADNSAIVALVTPNEESLAMKTLNLLPASIPRLILKSKTTNAFSSLELLIKSFRLIESIGNQRHIDPGRPGVPGFGRKLYNLKYASLLNTKSTGKTKGSDLLPILKKAKVDNLSALTAEQFEYWSTAYKRFLKGLAKTKFGAVVFDYDGTLCRPMDRFERLSTEVKASLNQILKNGFVIGVVTGRGQSVRKELQAAIDKKFWSQVLVGYYNGADIAPLGDHKSPRKDIVADSDLTQVYKVIKEYSFPFEVRAELRPMQLTIEINDATLWKRIRPLLLQLIMSSKASNIQVLESSHSMDVIKRPEVSKLNILPPCIEMNKQFGVGTACLCIGDRGQWPGNDFELLATEYALSVDEVSSDRDHGWNIAPAGIKGVDATLLYLEQIKFSKSHFNLLV